MNAKDRRRLLWGSRGLSLRMLLQVSREEEEIEEHRGPWRLADISEQL